MVTSLRLRGWGGQPPHGFVWSIIEASVLRCPSLMWPPSFDDLHIVSHLHGNGGGGQSPHCFVWRSVMRRFVRCPSLMSAPSRDEMLQHLFAYPVVAQSRASYIASTCVPGYVCQLNIDLRRACMECYDRVCRSQWKAHIPCNDKSRCSGGGLLEVLGHSC
jgi:hypothetical protein